MKRRRLKETLFVMLSGAFGLQITKGTSTPKWRTSLSFLRKRSSKDLKIGMCQNHSQCLGLVRICTRNCIKSTMGIFKTQIKSTDRRIIPRSGNRRPKIQILFPYLKVKQHKRSEIKVNQSP